MPLTSQTECIVRDNHIYSGFSDDPSKFLIYVWEGHSQLHGGNLKISMPLTVVSRTPLELGLTTDPHTKLPPRITLGKPIPPEPPIIMGGGVPIIGLTASSKVDPKTQKRSDEYKFLRSQALPAQERHEYKAYPEDILPGKNTRHKRLQERDQTIYHSYLSLSWQYLGLQERILDCLNNLESICIAHCIPSDMLQQSLYKGSQNMRFSSALRHRMETFISQGRVSLLMGNLKAVATQIEVITGQALSENEIHELERFQSFEELASLDRGLPVLYLYPFNNIYELEKAELSNNNETKYSQNTGGPASDAQQPLPQFRCLLQPGPLQQKLENYTDSSLYL